jgi:hypothetical protein
MATSAIAMSVMYNELDTRTVHSLSPACTSRLSVRLYHGIVLPVCSGSASSFRDIPTASQDCRSEHR